MSFTKKSKKKNASITQTLVDNVESIKNKRLAEKEKVSKKAKLSKKVKESDIHFEEDKLKNDILNFNEKGFVVLNVDDLEKAFLEVSVSEGTNILNSWKLKPLKVFFAINSRLIFEGLLEAINQEAVAVITQEKHAESMFKYYAKVSMIDLLKFIGLYILLEGKFGNESPTHLGNFKVLKEEEGFDMGYNRYKAIMGCIKPTNDLFDELVNEWITQSKDHWIPGAEVTVDESVYAYEVRPETKKKYLEDKDPVPMHFVPVKPHRNGLFAWALATKSAKTNKPFLLDMIPHYKYVLTS